MINKIYQINLICLNILSGKKQFNVQDVCLNKLLLIKCYLLTQVISRGDILVRHFDLCSKGSGFESRGMLTN